MKKIIFILLLSIISCGHKWLETVTGYDANDAKNGYAGILGRKIYAIRIVQYKFRVHIIGKGWGDEISPGGTGGDFNNPIDAIAISGTTYRVYADDHWLPSVAGYNPVFDINGYAGNLGSPISGLMVKNANYAVAIYD